MTAITSAFRRDANGVPITTRGIQTSHTVTFTATGDGAVGSIPLFTVTGDVLAQVFAVCSTLLDSDGAATVEVGITGNTAAIIAQTTATTIDAGEIWYDNTPVTVGAEPGYKILTNGTDILQKIATETVKAGVLTYYCNWVPLSDGADVTPA